MTLDVEIAIYPIVFDLCHRIGGLGDLRSLHLDGDQKQQQPEKAPQKSESAFALIVPGKCGRDDRQVLFDLLPVALFFSFTEFRVGS